MKLYDKTGREICVFDTLKVYHFTDRLHGKKHYSYKYVIEQIKREPDPDIFRVVHLNGRLSSFYLEPINGRRMDTVEIVQGYGGCKFGGCFSDREQVAG